MSILELYRSRAVLARLLCAVAASRVHAPAPQKAPPVPVQVAPVTTISAPLTIGANGVVEPLQTVAVQAQVNGTLDAVNFREGDDVQAGQMLFRIDARPYEATLRQVEATLARDEARRKTRSVTPSGTRRWSKRIT